MPALLGKSPFVFLQSFPIPIVQRLTDQVYIIISSSSLKKFCIQQFRYQFQSPAVTCFIATPTKIQIQILVVNSTFSIFVVCQYAPFVKLNHRFRCLTLFWLGKPIFVGKTSKFSGQFSIFHHFSCLVLSFSRLQRFNLHCRCPRLVSPHGRGVSGVSEQTDSSEDEENDRHLDLVEWGFHSHGGTPKCQQLDGSGWCL